MSPNGSNKADSLLTRWVRAGLAGLGLVSAVAASSVGCLDRPVSPASPNTTNVFVQDIRQTTIDKIDLLFMIDNSISMADKQAILELKREPRAAEVNGPITVLVNNAAFQEHVNDLAQLTEEHFDRTVKTNLYGYFHMVKAAVPRMTRPLMPWKIAAMRKKLNAV